jgi:lysophospholipase
VNAAAWGHSLEKIDIGLRWFHDKTRKIQEFKRYIPDISRRINIRTLDMTDEVFRFLRTDDGDQLRFGFWPQPGHTCRGSAVIMGGRTEFMEKYLDTIRKLNARGFDAFSMDWRGQGLSSRLLPDSTRGYIDSYDRYVGDLELFFEKVVRPRSSGPLIAIAHSMGGNILAQYLSKWPQGVDKGVMLAPMIKICTDPIPETVARLACRMATRLGHGCKNIPAFKRHDSFNRSFPGNRLTHDEQRFNRVRALVCENPQVEVVGVTYGWLDASFNAIDAINRPGFAQGIRTPMLVVVAGEDRVVRNQAICRFAGQLPEHRLFRINGAYHEILQELDDLQDLFWHAFDRFVQR